MIPRLQILDAAGLAHAQAVVARHHYLRKPVDVRCMPEAYAIRLDSVPGPVGFFILGRPQATKCFPWYGSLEETARGRAEVTRWQVLNLARVYFDPRVQPGGERFGAGYLPGFVDRRHAFRSTLGSAAITELAHQVVRDYLIRRPPCFLEEPYELRWLLSYCDTRLHRGTLYRAAGFELWRTNAAGIQTWRRPLRALTPAEDAEVRAAAESHPRSIRFREQRRRAA
jgi:hypothetical protein